MDSFAGKAVIYLVDESPWNPLKSLRTIEIEAIIKSTICTR